MSTDLLPPMPHAACVSTLGAAERLVLLSFRWWVLGWAENQPLHWARVWHGFREDFGVRAANAALSSFAAALQVIRCEARRPIHYRAPCCGRVSNDESTLLRIVAASQHRHTRAAAARARWLVHERGIAALTDAAEQFGGYMEDVGLTLPVATAPSPARDRLAVLDAALAELALKPQASAMPAPAADPIEHRLLEISSGERI